MKEYFCILEEVDYTYLERYLLLYISMKVLFPRHIKKGLLAGIQFTFWPITIWLWQLLIIAVWAASSFGVATYFMKNEYSKVIAIIFASPIFLLSLAFAFFSISEMGLLQFLIKIVRTKFFDTSIKYQVDIAKPYPGDLLLLKRKENEKTDVINYKKSLTDNQSVKSSQEDSLL